MLTKNFTHVNAANQPTMVDVGQKMPTRRVARAHCRVVLGEELLSRVQAGEMPSHKGPVIHTAILAGIMGAKKSGNQDPKMVTLSFGGPAYFSFFFGLFCRHL